MKINFNFDVVARCKVYPNGSEDCLIAPEDIVLTFDIEKAGGFLFKFGPNAFKFDNYKARLKYDNNGSLSGLFLADEDNTYICTNFKQLVSDVHQGYIRLQMLDKITDIMEFDFKAGIDLQNPIEDEFE
jgi:hypothetical protein